MVTLGAQVALVGLVFAAGTWHWSDVPWSHFFAAFLAVAVYAARFVPVRTTIASAAATGAALSLLSLTRSFELVAVLLAWGFALVALAALRLSGPRVLRLGHVAAGVAAFAVTTAAVYVADRQARLLLPVREQPRPAVGQRPARGVRAHADLQLLASPREARAAVRRAVLRRALLALGLRGRRAIRCRREVLGGAKAAGNERLWRLPIAVQLPSLVLLPLCVLAVAGIVVWALRNREAARRRVARDPAARRVDRRRDAAS